MIKKLQSNFTTPEQSNRLLELGVPSDSADCWLTMTDEIFEGRHRPHVRTRGYEIANSFFELRAESVLPCWSVGRLNEIFKICSDNHIEIYDLDLEGTQIERAMQAFENYAKYNWLDFSKLEDYE